MAEPRIERLSEEDARAAAQGAGLPEAMATLNVFRVLLHHPELTGAIGGLLQMLLFRGVLDRRLRELVIMRIGWRTGSLYEWTQHWRVARQLDVSEADLLAVRDWRSADLDEAARAVLQATDDTLERGSIAPGAWRACERALPDRRALLELVAAIGTWMLFSQLLQSRDIPLEDGVAPWPPDGERP